MKTKMSFKQVDKLMHEVVFNMPDSPTEWKSTVSDNGIEVLSVNNDCLHAIQEIANFATVLGLSMYCSVKNGNVVARIF